MSGIINCDWVDPGERIREMEEIQDEEAEEEEMHLEEGRREDITMDKFIRVGATDGLSLHGPFGIREMDERNDNTSRAIGVGTNAHETEDNATITESEGTRSRAKDDRAIPAKVGQDVHQKNADNKESNQLQSVTEKNEKLDEENLKEIKDPKSQPMPRSYLHTCGLLSFVDSERKGGQLTPVETDSLTQMQIKNQCDNVEISNGNFAHDTKDSSCLEKPTIELKPPTGYEKNDTPSAIETTFQSEENVQSAGDKSEDDGSSSDGDFSTGSSSSSNSLGDIEGVIARMNPACRQKVVRPLKATMSLQSSTAAQKHNQRVVSKSETTSSPGGSGYHRGQKPTKDVTIGRKQRQTGSQSRDTKELISTVSISPVQATTSDNPDRFKDKDVSDMVRQENSLATPTQGSNSANEGESSTDVSDEGEDFSDGDFSTGPSGSSALGDIKDGPDKIPQQSKELGEDPMKLTQSLRTSQLGEKPANKCLAKSDTDSACIPKKGVVTQKQRAKEIESTECNEVTNEIETDEQRLTDDTVPVDEPTLNATQETQQPSLKRNPRFARKRSRATTPVKAKPRKRIVNFASFENIRLFSSAKHLLVTSSLVGKSRVRVKKGVMTPEEKALREEEIREQTKMDSDEKMEKQLNFRMGLLKDFLSDSDQEEEIDGYYQKDQPSESLVNTSCEVVKPLGNTSCKTAEPLGNTFCETAEPLGNTFCETAEPLENTSCEDATADEDRGVSSPFPDFSAIASGDIDTLTQATDALFGMMEEPRDKLTEMTAHQMVGSPTDERMVGTSSNEDEVINRADDPVVDTAVDWSSDDKDTPPAVENVRPSEQPVRRAGKLTRFIRGVGRMFRKAIDRTRQLTTTCCLKPATD